MSFLHFHSVVVVEVTVSQSKISCVVNNYHQSENIQLSQLEISCVVRNYHQSQNLYFAYVFVIKDDHQKLLS